MWYEDTCYCLTDVLLMISRLCIIGHHFPSSHILKIVNSVLVVKADYINLFLIPLIREDVSSEYFYIINFT